MIRGTVPSGHLTTSERRRALTVEIRDLAREARALLDKQKETPCRPS
jgi:hypothetical protein